MKITLPDALSYGTWIDLELCVLRADARYHSEEDILKLANSMEVKQLQAIVVCRYADDTAPGGFRYEVIAGVGRVLSARSKNWIQIRADIYEGLSEFQKLDVVFSENEDRKNASPLYQCQMIKRMMEMENLSQEELAERLGKTQQNVSQYAVLRRLGPKFWTATTSVVKLGLKHFVQLLRIENETEQWKLAEMALAKGLSADSLRTVIDKQLGRKSGPKKAGRPRGDKNMGADGFAVVRQAGKLRVKAVYDPAVDVDTFLAGLKTALLRLCPPSSAAPKADSTVTPAHTSVPVPVIKTAEYVEGNKLRLTWAAVEEATRYKIFRAYHEAEDAPLTPMDTEVTTPGAIINLYADGLSALNIAVMALDAQGHESELSQPVRFQLKAWNDQNSVAPLA